MPRAPKHYSRSHSFLILTSLLLLPFIFRRSIYRAGSTQVWVVSNNDAKKLRVIDSAECSSRGTQVMLEGNKWLFHADDLITKSVVGNGFFEKPISEFIRRSMSISDGILVDVGANVGVMTSVALFMGRKVVAVEALPDNALMLWCSASIHGLNGNLKIYNVPLADTRGASEILCVCRPQGNPSDGILVRKEEFEEHPYCGGEKGTVKTCEEELESVTFDELQISEPIAFMKMDIEGNECRALEGSLSTIISGAPCVIHTEFNPSLQVYSNCSMHRSMQTMAALGYSPHIFLWHDQDCSSAELTLEGLQEIDVPGAINNICWKPQVPAAHCNKYSN